MDNNLKHLGKIADATKEVAKTTGKVVDAASGVGQFFNKVFGEIVIDGFGLVQDRLKFYRLELAVLLAEKTQKKLTERGVKDFRPVPPKVALPLIENATLEEDEHLHSLWANLLASALDNEHDEVEKKFVSVLSEMSSEDAFTLESIYADWCNPELRKQVNIGHLNYGEGVRGSDFYSEISVITLNRLGLVAPSYVGIKTYNPPVHHDRYGEIGPSSDYVKVYGDIGKVVVTEFGVAFCKAVAD